MGTTVKQINAFHTVILLCAALGAAQSTYNAVVAPPIGSMAYYRLKQLQQPGLLQQFSNEWKVFVTAVKTPVHTPSQ